MKRQPGKLREVKLGPWIFGQARGQAGLSDYHRAFTLGHGVKGGTESFAASIFLFLWGEQPYDSHASFRQSL